MLRVVISGAGIAGLTLAALLRRSGAEVMVVERAPRLRGEGYMLDFWGAGYDVAEAMALLPALERIHYPVGRLDTLDASGRLRYAIRYAAMRRVLGGRHFNFMRGDLERVLYGALGPGADIRFGATVAVAGQDREGVDVTISSGGYQESLRCDVLVGADGVHSRTRRQVSEPECARPLGYETAAFLLDRTDVRADLGDAFSLVYTPGRQVVVYPVRDGRVATFFLHRAQPQTGPPTDARATLRARYADMGWVVPDLLAALERADQFYYDAVEQVEAPRWSRGRIVLVGDAACCVSLVAGQGASVAMGGAAVLARALAESAGDVPGALGRYERAFRPEVERVQASARQFAAYFVPETGWTAFVRDLSVRMLEWPLVWRLLRGQFAGARLPAWASPDRPRALAS